MLTKDEFINCVRSLYNIEGWQVDGLLGLEQDRYMVDPALFLIHASDQKQDAIWRQVEKRQHPRKLTEKDKIS